MKEWLKKLISAQTLEESNKAIALLTKKIKSEIQKFKALESKTNRSEDEEIELNELRRKITDYLNEEIQNAYVKHKTLLLKHVDDILEKIISLNLGDHLKIIQLTLSQYAFNKNIPVTNGVYSPNASRKYLTKIEEQLARKQKKVSPRFNKNTVQEKQDEHIDKEDYLNRLVILTNSLAELKKSIMDKQATLKSRGLEMTEENKNKYIMLNNVLDNSEGNNNTINFASLEKDIQKEMTTVRQKEKLTSGDINKNELATKFESLRDRIIEDLKPYETSSNWSSWLTKFKEQASDAIKEFFGINTISTRKLLTNTATILNKNISCLFSNTGKKIKRGTRFDVQTSMILNRRNSAL